MHWQISVTIRGRCRLGSATRTFNTRLDIPSWRPIGSRASGADAASARTPRLWPYEHQPGIDRGEHSVVHFQVRFVSLTFVALFIALSVIVSKDCPLRSVIRTVARICSHIAPKSQA